MARLCERPGCSERGAIAYGFDADRQLVWLTPLDPEADRNRAGTMCVRHADAMVVPLGWTLEDARDPMPRLFKPATRARPARPARRKEPRPKRPAAVDQLPLDDSAEPTPPESALLAPVTDAGDAHTVLAVTGVASAPDDPDATVSMPWMPDFDITDELGGALSAETPLLARAFRGIDRHHA